VSTITVGLYNLNSVYPGRLNAPGFNLCAYEVKTCFLRLLSYVYLYRYSTEDNSSRNRTPRGIDSRTSYSSSSQLQNSQPLQTQHPLQTQQPRPQPQPEHQQRRQQFGDIGDSAVLLRFEEEIRGVREEVARLKRNPYLVA
jgi:hypothetical protein